MKIKSQVPPEEWSKIEIRFENIPYALTSNDELRKPFVLPEIDKFLNTLEAIWAGKFTEGVDINVSAPVMTSWEEVVTESVISLIFNPQGKLKQFYIFEDIFDLMQSLMFTELDTHGSPLQLYFSPDRDGTSNKFDFEALFNEENEEFNAARWESLCLWLSKKIEELEAEVNKAKQTSPSKSGVGFFDYSKKDPEDPKNPPKDSSPPCKVM